MDFEKAYKEALNWMRDIYPTLAGSDKEDAEHYFPELKESEDERIRKEIIHYILYKANGVSEEQEHEWVAYLEKQKEQKEEPVERWQYVGEVDLKENREEQKPNIELIQKSWYMEGYHDKEFNKEPKWIIKTGEGGPRYEENPKYGQIIEQKPAEWSEFDKGVLKDAICATDILGNDESFNKGNPNLGKAFRVAKDWLKSLPERFNPQPKAEWSKDYREEDIQTRFAFYTYKDDASVLYLSNVFVEESSRNHGFGTRILKAAEKAAEAIGAITISLKVKQDSPANAWYRKRGYGYVAFEDGYDWLEKNLEYLKPKPKQEWSEEDEETRKDIIAGLEATKQMLYKADASGQACYNRWIDWLKSLRPSWKPSEEQMKMLAMFTNLRCASRREANILESLYNDLKKL